MNSKHLSSPVNRPGDSHEQPNGPEPVPLFGQEPRCGPDISNDSPPASTKGAGPVKPPAPPSEQAPPNGGPPDPFDPARLRLSQDFASAVDVRTVLTMVPVRKPSKEWWVRTQSDPAYQLPTALLELKEDRETYLVARELWPELVSEPTFAPTLLITAINRQNVLFLWPVRLPGPDGKVNPWHQSALDAAERARSDWTRVYADMAMGGYRVEYAPSLRAEPNWPELPMSEILRVAFRDRHITTRDHPILQRLRGEV